MGLKVAKTIFLIFLNSIFYQYNLGLYDFKIVFWCFCHFFIKIRQKRTFLGGDIYIRFCWLHVHNQQDNNMLGHKKLSPSNVCIC